ncbi:transglutaminase family protein [Salinicola rhizosphaerae]|uniref:Transglutaminase n=1 Tax=Salinicola rhizosphaerae TaxID=1443141 RepID=A0ABQ3DMT0_9GAMM|nr:transglutaminase family protein [Salinicola rhizosphaerae]GHB08446.1 transglutaminase [Salinicola rhizosphaerae]
MRYRVSHETRYEYASPVSLCHNEARVAPRQLPWQRVAQSELAVVPAPQVIQWRQDFFGNDVAYFSVQEVHQTLTVTASSRLETSERPLPPQATNLDWQQALGHVGQRATLRQFQLDSPFVGRHSALRRFAAPSFATGRGLIDALDDLNLRIFETFVYDPGFTTLATPVLDVLEARRGVCQDFAHLMIGCLRSMGLSARYVSGYLETLPPPGQPRLVGADASHAWVAVHIPEWGWLELDPTNGARPGMRHLVLAWGRDYGDVPPLKGVMSGGGTHQLEVAVDVEPIAGESRQGALSGF